MTVAELIAKLQEADPSATVSRRSQYYDDDPRQDESITHVAVETDGTVWVQDFDGEGTL
jgi:hypothetical protein